eukprot:GILK01008032.1.p1 GENE.GILK01008032.1~~GILK01008032.1.p1  ORF type:complete len:203 (+),score=21.73 GILK01008032.1:35-643(+)
MVEFVCTSKVLDILREIGREDVVEQRGDTMVITLIKLKSIKLKLQEHGHGFVSLLRGTKLHLPGPVQPKGKPEMELWRKRLRAKQEERKYQQSVKSLTHDTSSSVALSAEDRNSFRQQMSLSAHFIVSFFLAFLTGYYIGQLNEWDQTACYITGLFFSIFVLLLETSLYLIRSFKEEKIASMNAKQKGRQHIVERLSTMKKN